MHSSRFYISDLDLVKNGFARSHQLEARELRLDRESDHIFNKAMSRFHGTKVPGCLGVFVQVGYIPFMMFGAFEGESFAMPALFNSAREELFFFGG
jgi:hypothetical protein